MSRRMRTSGTSQVKPVSKSKSKKNKPSKSVTKASQELVKAKDKVDKATEKLRQTISQNTPSIHQASVVRVRKRNRHVNIKRKQVG